LEGWGGYLGRRGVAVLEREGAARV
jgi:hypothetical protein